MENREATERMSISGLLDVLNTGISLSTCHIEYAIQSNVLEDLIKCLEELEQYKNAEQQGLLLRLPVAIGTIEESERMKCPYRNFEESIVEQCPSCEYEEVKTETISGRYPSYMTLEKALSEGYAWKETKTSYKFVSCKLVENNVIVLEEVEQEIRAKAIDEFAEKCNKKITEFILEHQEQLTFVSGVSMGWKVIDETAEEMKAGGQHE